MEDESITILGKLYQKIYFHYLILKEKITTKPLMHR